MSRILLNIFAVLNKLASWSKFKIPGVPILVTHIIKLLVTAPSAPITTGITDTLLQLHIFFLYFHFFKVLVVVDLLSFVFGNSGIKRTYKRTN